MFCKHFVGAFVEICPTVRLGSAHMTQYQTKGEVYPQHVSPFLSVYSVRPRLFRIAPYEWLHAEPVSPLIANEYV